MLDPNGDKTIHGRFFDYEYILSSDSPKGEVKERLAVSLDTSFNSITGMDIGK
ncbi:hypothetical protein PH210_06145 [Paenibacillus sp. BSR1-1]|uniref:hypothetical protein n=1 Tax=Paenibacillus sp. BSR1-1 TaxID=3020845 RepID=UPI0025B1103B|nr:hypothetical protein [Paenibacillus sp. BSR1-1]MDN3015786.1 hypothetical protein [Paenibacillus sp. BSR1-1]